MLALHRRRIARRSPIPPVQQVLIFLGVLFVILGLLKFPSDIGTSQPRIPKSIIVKNHDEDLPRPGIVLDEELEPQPKPISTDENKRNVFVDESILKPFTEEASIRKDSNDNVLLSNLLAKYKVPKTVVHPLDYGNAEYDTEAASMIRGINPSTRDPVDLSMLLMTRPGHRTRVTHLIGGEHLDPKRHRAKLQAQAKVFANPDQPLTPKSTRDFDVNPISTSVQCSSPVPCASSGVRDGHSTMMSMENLHCQQVNVPFSFCASPQLSSDVPMLYISWHDFGLLKPADVRKKKELAVAYISNCSFRKRNSMVEDLVRLTGHKVKSFGSCAASGDAEPVTPGIFGRNQQKKLAVLEISKFSLAFENSETTDYVTEKFFGSLCAGSVPVVIGDPEIEFWAPDTTPYPYRSNALLKVSDYGDNSKIVADVLQELDKNPQAYEQLLTWKEKGYSDDFKAVGDLGDVHSHCRSCILIGDDLRHRDGPNVYDIRNVKDVYDMNRHDFALFVRERGNYSFTRLGFRGRPTLRELVASALRNIPMRPKNLWANNPDKRNQPTRVYAFYVARPGRAAVLSDQDINALPNGCELEMIYI